MLFHMAHEPQLLGRRPLLIGHRGAPRLADENTVVSFRKALEAGLDGVETDVQRTADGALVLHHDALLHGGIAIASIALTDLRQLAPAVPLLDELLPVMADFPAARLNLEVKTAAPYGDTRATDVASALAGWPKAVRARTWLSTFDPLLLLALEEAVSSDGSAVPATPVAFLMASANAERLLPVLPVSAVHPHHALVTAERVRRWHARGLQVYTWTVNDPEQALRLLTAGVDGLIGDIPDLLMAARSLHRGDQGTDEPCKTIPRE